MDPVVERRDGDSQVLTEIRYCTGTVKVFKKDSKNEPQGIGSKWNQGVREEGMCASAATALESGDDEFSIGTPAVIHRDHVSSIWLNPGEPADCAALRTAAGGRLKAGDSHVKELKVREM